MTKASNKFGGQFVPVPRWVLKYLRGDATTLTIFTYALTYMDSDTQKITTSYDHLAEITGTSRSTVIRSMHKLVELGAIHKTKRRSAKGNSQTNIYTVDFNTPESKIQGGVMGDTTQGVTGDTTLVSWVTPSGGVMGDTQSIENNHSLHGGTKRIEKPLPSVIMSDPKWKRQFQMLEKGNQQ
jgi:hypothetical protein